MIIPYLIDAIGFWVFIMFALINLIMLAPIYLFYVGELEVIAFFLKSYNYSRLTETANRHLEEMDILFSGDSCLSWRAEKHFAETMAAQRDGLGDSSEKTVVEQIE